MGKQVKAPKVHKDPFARTSYLFQAASFYSAHKMPVMARMMARNVDLVAKRTVLRLSPHLKRKICKGCNTVMIPGLTMSAEVENVSKKSSKSETLIHKCLCCDFTKRYPIGKDPLYELHCDKNELKLQGN